MDDNNCEPQELRKGVINGGDSKPHEPRMCVPGNSLWSTEFDGLEDILVRLPILSLIECRTVCKAWNKAISSGNLQRSWSKAHCATNSWVVMIDWPLGLEATSFIFYNVHSHEWHVKAFRFGEILDRQFAYDGYLLATSTTARGLIFFLPDYFLPARCDRSILVLNPLVNTYQLISLPNLSNSRHVNLGVAIKMTVAFDREEHDLRFEPDPGQGQPYKILFVCSHGDDVWSCQVYSPVTERWALVMWPAGGERFNRHYSAEDCFWDVFAVQRLSGASSSSCPSFNPNPNFALIVYSGAAPDDIRGCVDLLSFDPRAESFSRLSLPWAWDRTNYPNFKLGFIQRDQTLINPFLEVTMDFECQSIHINTLTMGLGVGPVGVPTEGVWRTRAVMPQEFFESLHSGLNRRCHEDAGRPYDCFTRMKCLTDTNGDRLLFLSSTTSYIHVVTYQFSAPSQDRAWGSIRYPVEDYLGLNDILRSPPYPPVSRSSTSSSAQIHPSLQVSP